MAARQTGTGHHHSYSYSAGSPAGLGGAMFDTFAPHRRSDTSPAGTLRERSSFDGGVRQSRDGTLKADSAVHRLAQVRALPRSGVKYRTRASTEFVLGSCAALRPWACCVQHAPEASALLAPAAPPAARPPARRPPAGLCGGAPVLGAGRGCL